MTRFLRDLHALGLDDAAALVSLALGAACFAEWTPIIRHWMGG